MAEKHAATKPAPTYPRVVYVHDDSSPGYRAVTVKDADAEKALGAPVFDTALEAAEFSPPVDQPIDHIARTQNEEQFVPGKSQIGAAIPAGVIQTPVPVRNVYVKTGVDPDSLGVKAVLPEGVDPAVLKEPMTPTTTGAPMASAPAKG